jgi:hypothetical protein
MTSSGAFHSASSLAHDTPNQSLEPNPLAAVKSTFDFMKQLSMFAALAVASGGSAPSR